MDPNVIQIRDAFFLAKRQYELCPGLLTDLDVCTLYHGLVNIRTVSQLGSWLRDMARSPFHYENAAAADAGVYGNVMGEVERIALELTDRQRQAAAKEFARLGSVDIRVIDYATSKYRTVIRKGSGYFDDLDGLSLRTAVAALLSADDADTLTGCLRQLGDSSLPPEIRDYVDFVGTLSAEEADALLINNRLCGDDNDSVMETIDAIRDGLAYCRGVIRKAMYACGTGRHLSATPRSLTFSTDDGDGSCRTEHRIAVLRLSCDRADAWLANGRHLDIEAAVNSKEGELSDFMEQAVTAVGDYLATTRRAPQKYDDALLACREDPVIFTYTTVKGDHPNDLLVMRQDGYYEVFGDDAVIAAGILRHNVWMRHAEHDASTVTLILTGDELTELRRHCSRVYVCTGIRERDDEDLHLEPTFLNILLDYCYDLPLKATVFEKQDRRLAVRGDLAGTHFPPKDLSAEDADCYVRLSGKAERDAAARALFLKKNGAELHRLMTATYN